MRHLILLFGITLITLIACEPETESDQLNQILTETLERRSPTGDLDY